MAAVRTRWFTVAVVLGLLGLVLAMQWVVEGRPALAGSGIWYVCPEGPPTCDFANIQDGVDIAGEGDLIKVARGIYTGVHSRPIPPGYLRPPSLEMVSQVVYLTKTLTIQGGYTIDFSDPPNPIANPTTLDAQGQGRALFISGAISPTLVGLRFTGGDPAGQGGAINENDAGGGIYVFSATATISDSEVFDNTAGYGGGGLYLTGSHAVLSGNTIYGNAAKYEGGGMWLSKSAGIFRDNTVSGNSAEGACGGGLSLWHSNTLLWRNIIRANTAALGGGMFLYDSPAEIRGNTIAFNIADSYGGGLGLHYSNATLEGNTISDNTASGRGGGVLLGHSDATLINNIIARNRADDMGCGIYVDDSFPLMLHTTIASNKGSSGIGLTGMGYSIAMTNSILVSHTIGIEIASGNTAVLNATLWGTSTWANDMDWGGDGVIITGSANYWGNPAFIHPDLGNYHITEYSAAKDAGVNAGVNTDIDGQVRPYDLGYDIGADEFHPYSYIYLPVVMRNGTSCIAAGDLLHWFEGEQCCAGLSEIDITHPCDSPGVGGCKPDGCFVIPPCACSVCAPCGDGVCQPEYRENPCSCPVDCR